MQTEFGQSARKATRTLSAWEPPTARQSAALIRQLGYSHNVGLHGISVDPEAAKITREQVKAEREFDG